MWFGSFHYRSSSSLTLRPESHHNSRALRDQGRVDPREEGHVIRDLDEQVAGEPDPEGAEHEQHRHQAATHELRRGRRGRLPDELLDLGDGDGGGEAPPDRQAARRGAAARPRLRRQKTCRNAQVEIGTF